MIAVYCCYPPLCLKCMFRNRKCEFVSSAFGPNHEGGSQKIRRLQRETERGPEEGKMCKTSFHTM